MKSFTIEEVIEWLLTQPDEETFSYFNSGLSRGCFFTKFANAKLNIKNALVNCQGRVEGTDYKVPFHNMFWEMNITEDGIYPRVTKVRALETLRALQEHQLALDSHPTLK